MSIFKAELSQSPAYDPNWFLSTVVQSTAGFIAIMAGFLLNRLVSLNSEKRTLENRLSEIRTKKQIAEDEIKSISRVINSQTFRWFEQDALESLIDDPKQDLEDLVAQHLYRGSDDERMLAYAKELVEIITRLEKEISSVSTPPAFPPKSKEEFFDKGIKLNSDLEENIALGISNRITESRRSVLGVSLPTLPNYIVPLNSDKQIARHDAQIARRETIREQVRYLEGEMGGLSAQIMNLPAPKNLLHGFAILFYFGSVGVFYPLIEMSHNPTQLDINNRTFIIWSYSLGFVWLLGYILKSIYTLLDIPDWMKKIKGMD